MAGRTSIAVAAGLILLLAVNTPSSAANLKATPEMILNGIWDTNIFNSEKDKTSDFFLRANPKLTLSIEVFQTTVSLSGGFELEKYVDHTELDKNTATKNFDLTAQQPIQFTPRFSMVPSAQYVETEDAVRRNVLTESPSPGLPPSETAITARTGVRQISGSMKVSYLISPSVDAELGGGWRKREFTNETSGLFDSRILTGNASLKYRLTPRSSAGIYFDTSYNSFTDQPDSRSYTGGLTGTYRITERSSVDASAGATLDRESAGPATQKREEWLPTGRLSVTYVLETFRAALSGSHELAGGGSFGQTTKRANAVLTIGGQFSEKWGWDLSGSYQTNRSTDEAVTVDLEYANGRAGIRYMPARWATLMLSGNVSRQRSHGLTGSNLQRESVMLGVTLGETYAIF